jgi:hypothetical protein
MRFLFLILLSTSLLSCDVTNRDEEAVSFLRFEELPLVIQSPSVEGSASENITDVWLNVDGVLIGGFELPVSVPVIGEGPVTVQVFAGILENGLTSIRRRYPFYDFDEIVVDLVDEAEITITPTITYIPDVVGFSIEDFEQAGFNIESASDSDTTFVSIPNPDLSDSHRGTAIGAAYLDDEHTNFKAITQLELDIADKNIAYVELDYKVEGPFRIGFKRNGSPFTEISMIGVNPKLDENGNPRWNKIYVNIADYIDILLGAPSYEIFLEADLQGSGTRSFFFDNLKVVYPEQ